MAARQSKVQMGNKMKEFIKILAKFMSMINNKEDGMNDFGTANAPQTSNQDVQQQDVIVNVVDIIPNQSISNIVPEDQYFEVVEKKEPKFGNMADFQRLLTTVMMRSTQRTFNPPPRPETIVSATQLQKKMSLKKESDAVQHKAKEEKKAALLKAIEPHVKNFKVLNTANSSDTQVTKLRAEFKQKSFRFLLYGIEQFKQLKQEDLSQEERKIAALTSKYPYALAKTLVTQIDVEFLKNINMENRQTASKKYKSFLKNFMTNIESNFDLRRKILTRTLPARKLATMSEEQFLPAHIRERLEEKKNILLSEAAAHEKPVVIREDQYEYRQEEYQPPVVQKKEEEKKPKYRYLDEANIIMLRDLLKQEQILKMRKIFDQDLRKDIEDRLTNSINKVFDLAP